MSANEISPEEINFLLIQLMRQHFFRVHTLMKGTGIYRGQPPLLHELWKEEGCSQADLAARLHIQPATVTKMLQRMELAGFVERRADRSDQRVSRVYLTEAGRAVREDICRREQQVGEDALTGFTPLERAQLADFLIRMRDNLLGINGTEEVELPSSPFEALP